MNRDSLEMTGAERELIYRASFANGSRGNPRGAHVWSGHKGRPYNAEILSDLPPRCHAPGPDHHAIPHGKRFVVHIHTGANVVGDDSEDFTDKKLMG
jgi:hypothetical protein